MCLGLLHWHWSPCSVVRVAWSETGYGSGNSVISDITGRSGMFKMGCDYGCGVCHGTNNDGSICQLKRLDGEHDVCLL